MKLGWRLGSLYLTVAAMEGCWLYTLLVLLNKQVADGKLSLLGLLPLYPLAFIYNSLLARWRMPRLVWHCLSWLAWLVVMLLMVKIQLFSDSALTNPVWLLAVPRAVAEMFDTFRPELLILLSTAVFWSLGRRLAHLRVNFATVVTEFQFGLIVLLITFFFAYQFGVVPANSVYLALCFFLFTLVGVSVAHALEGTSWLSGLRQGHWSGLLLISISLVLILGLIISAVVTPDLLKMLWAAIVWLGGIVLGLIMKVLTFLASLLPLPEPGELPPELAGPQIGAPREFKMWTIPEPVSQGLRWGWGVLMLGIILVALWRISSDIFGWLRRRLSGTAEAEFEPLPGAFKTDLLSMLKRILFKLFGWRLTHWLRVRSGAVLPEVASVRQVYRQLLRWAASGGYPRHISQTPHEYLYTLINLLPEAQVELTFVTQQYVEVRYGTSLSTKDKLYQLRQSWHRIRQNHLKRASAELTKEEVR